METVTAATEGSRERVGWPDALVAAGAFAVAASTAALSAMRDGEAPFAAVAALVIVAQSAALVLRRHHPVLVLMVVGALTAVYGLVDWADPLVPVPVIVALATVCDRCSRPVALGALAIGAVSAVTVTALTDDSDVLDLGIVVLTLVAAPVLGEWWRSRREQVAALEARNVALSAEHARAVEEARVAERRRIARELHDVVTHNVTMLVVQAEAAAGAPSMDDADRIARFDDLAGGGRRALAELRQLLGVLRDPEDGTPSAPTPGIQDVGALVERARVSGLDVSYTPPDTLPELPVAVDLAAYRVVQEGLTNIVRHAGARHADVAVEVADGTVVITIEDDGVGGASVDGVGLAGLRERIRLLGGAVEAAPRPLGGFRLATRIPLAAS